MLFSVGNSFNLGIKLNNGFPLKMSASLTNIRTYQSTRKMNQSKSTEHENTEKSWEELIAELRGSRTFTEMQGALESGKGWGDLAMEEEERMLEEEERMLEERTARLSGQVAELTEVEKRLATMATEEDRYRRSSGFTYATWKQRRQALLNQRAELTAAVGETAAATARSAAAAATLAAQAAAQSAARAAAPAPVSVAALQRELESLPTARELSRPPWTATARAAIEQQRRTLMQRLAAARAPAPARAAAAPRAPQSRFAVLAEEEDSDSEYEADARLGI